MGRGNKYRFRLPRGWIQTILYLLVLHLAWCKRDVAVCIYNVIIASLVQGLLNQSGTNIKWWFLDFNHYAPKTSRALRNVVSAYCTQQMASCLSTRSILIEFKLTHHRIAMLPNSKYIYRYLHTQLLVDLIKMDADNKKESLRLKLKNQKSPTPTLPQLPDVTNLGIQCFKCGNENVKELVQKTIVPAIYSMWVATYSNSAWPGTNSTYIVHISQLVSYPFSLFTQWTFSSLFC